MYYGKDGKPSSILTGGAQHMLSEDIRLQDALVAMCDQAECEALHHSNRHYYLTCPNGPVETMAA